MKKHKALSSKSLELVWEWCERNDGSPLAEAYLAACAAVGALDCSKIADQLKPTWKKKEKFGYIYEAYKPFDIAFIYRDTVGRVIFDLLKREAKRRK